MESLLQHSNSEVLDFVNSRKDEIIKDLNPSLSPQEKAALERLLPQLAASLARHLPSFLLSKSGADDARVSESHCEKLFRSAGEAIFTVDRRGKLSSVNPEASRISGLLESELVGKHYTELLPEDSLEPAREVFQRTMLHGEIVRDASLAFKTADQRDIILEITAAPIFDDDGSVTEGLVVGRDVTARVRSQEDLLRLTQELSLRVRQLSCLSSISRAIDNSQSLDEMYEKVLEILVEKGFDAQNVVVAIRLTDDLGNLRPKAFSGVPDEKGVKEILETTPKYCAPLMRKSRQVGDLCVIFRGQGEVPESELSFLDVIAERLSAAMEKRWLENEILRQNRELSETGVSMDALNRELEETNQELAETKNFLMGLIESSTDAIFSLDIEGSFFFLSPSAESFFGKPASELIGKPLLQHVESPRNVIKFIADLKKQGHSNVRITVPRDESSVYAHFSGSLIRDNRGRSIGIVCIGRDISELRQLEEERVKSERLSAITQLSIAANDRINTPLNVILGNAQLIAYRLKVMNPEVLEPLKIIEREVWKISETLEKLSRLAQPVVKPIHLNGETMLDLDRSHFAAVPSVSLGASDKLPPVQILLVDDEEYMLDFLTRAIEMLGMTSLAAMDGDSALSLLRNESFNLVICDINMPHMDGLDLLGRIKEAWPQLPVLMITGWDKDVARKKAQNRGAQGFLGKPFRLDELKQEIENLLQVDEVVT